VARRKIVNSITGAVRGEKTVEENLPVVENSSPLLGIVKSQPAEQTGLVPQGLKVASDKPEGDVDLAKLDYSMGAVHDDEVYITGKTLMKRAAEVGAIGSLGLAAALLKAQDEGKEIFPVESRSVHYFIMPLTELQDYECEGCVAYFSWYGGRWGLHFRWLHNFFYPQNRFVRRSE